MFRQARAVKDERTLYETVKDWNYEYRPYRDVPEQEDPYAVVFSVVSEDVKFTNDAECCPLVSIDMFQDAELDRHEWTAMLTKAAVCVETCKEPLNNYLSSHAQSTTRKRTIAGSAHHADDDVNEKKGVECKRFVPGPEFTDLGVLLDGATSLFCFDAEHEYLLLKRLETDDDFVSEEGQNDEHNGKEERVGRYQRCFFEEQRIYHWRLKTNDIRGEWNKHKNRACSLRTLLHHHDIPFTNALDATRRAIYETHVWGRTWRDISHCEEVDVEA